MITSILINHLIQRIESSKIIPNEVIACKELIQTKQLWPNLTTIKISGLIAKLNYFDLSDSELSWLQSLSDAFCHLKTVFLQNRAENAATHFEQIYNDPFQWAITKEDEKFVRYQVRFFLDSNNQSFCRHRNKLADLKLKVIQIYFKDFK